MVAQESSGEVGTRLTVTYREAGDSLGVCERVVWQLVKDGRLKAVRIGRSVRIPSQRAGTVSSQRLHLPLSGPENARLGGHHSGLATLEQPRRFARLPVETHTGGGLDLSKSNLPPCVSNLSTPQTALPDKLWRS